MGRIQYSIKTDRCSLCSVEEWNYFIRLQQPTELEHSHADAVEGRSATFQPFKVTYNTISAYILQIVPSGNENKHWAAPVTSCGCGVTTTWRLSTCSLSNQMSIKYCHESSQCMHTMTERSLMTNIQLLRIQWTDQFVLYRVMENLARGSFCKKKISQ